MCSYRLWKKSLIIFFSVFLLNGCAARYYGYGPHFLPVNKNTQRVAVLSPDLLTFDISAGGVLEYRVDWSRLGKEQLLNSMVNQLRFKGFDARAAGDSLYGLNVDTLKSFVNLTASAIQKQLYGENAFIAQIDSFDYSIDSISELCNQLQVDAVMFLFCLDENYSDERINTLSRSATVRSARSAVFGTIAGIFTGVYANRKYSVPFERTYVRCLVANKDGRVLWYKQYLQEDGADFRLSADAGRIAKCVIEGFNRSKL